MKSEFNNPEYVSIIKYLKAELRKLKTQYKVPADNFDCKMKQLPNQLPRVKK